MPRYAAAMITGRDASPSGAVEAGEADFASALLEWEEQRLNPARRRGERKEQFETGSGIPVAPLYTPADLAGHDPLRDEGFPGEPPFTRGIQPTMYRGRLWSIRQYAGYGTAADANARFRYLLAQGQPGLSGAFALPPPMGRSDAPRPPLEHPPICGLRHRGRRQRTLSLPARPGTARALGRVRPADPDGARQRRPAERRGGRSGRRRDRLGA